MTSAGAPDEEIGAVVADFKQKYATAAPETPERSWTDITVDALPTIGGAVGGILGGISGLPAAGLGSVPAAIAGAGALGAGGEALRQLINRARGKGGPSSAGEALGNIATAGVWEGGTTAVGGAVGKHVIAPAARWATKAAFRPSREALKVNKNLTQDILDYGIKLSEKGRAKAQGLTTQAKQHAESLVDDLTNKPNQFLHGPQGTFQTHRANVDAELIDPVFRPGPQVGKATGNNALGKILDGADNVPGVNMARNVEESVRASLPKNVTPQHLLAIKRAEGAKAAKTFTDTPDVANRKSFNADLHKAADAALERRIGPKWNVANKETHRHLNTLGVVEEALGRKVADSHLISPYDQFLLMSGIVRSNPIDVGLALAREAGRLQQVPAALGRGAHHLNRSNVVTHGLRAHTAGVNEQREANEAKRRARLKKAEVDALWEQVNR